VREGEDRGVGLDSRQSLLHKTVFILCRAEVSNDDGKGRCEGTETGLAHCKSIGQGIHAEAGSKESCSSTWCNRHRRNILTERTYVSDHRQRLREGTADLV
jgi:hypothetical protein